MKKFDTKYELSQEANYSINNFTTIFQFSDSLPPLENHPKSPFLHPNPSLLWEDVIYGWSLICTNWSRNIFVVAIKENLMLYTKTNCICKFGHLTIKLVVFQKCSNFDSHSKASCVTRSCK